MYKIKLENNRTVIRNRRFIKRFRESTNDTSKKFIDEQGNIVNNKILETKQFNFIHYWNDHEHVDTNSINNNSNQIAQNVNNQNKQKINSARDNSTDSGDCTLARASSSGRIVKTPKYLKDYINMYQKA